MVISIDNIVYNVDTKMKTDSYVRISRGFHHHVKISGNKDIVERFRTVNYVLVNLLTYLSIDSLTEW